MIGHPHFAVHLGYFVIGGLESPEGPDKSFYWLNNRALKIKHLGHRGNKLDGFPGEQAVGFAHPAFGISSAHDEIGGFIIPNNIDRAVDFTLPVFRKEHLPGLMGNTGFIQSPQEIIAIGRFQALSLISQIIELEKLIYPEIGPYCSVFFGFPDVVADILLYIGPDLIQIAQVLNSIKAAARLAAYTTPSISMPFSNRQKIS